MGRSPGEEKGYPFQYSGLEKSMGVAKSQARRNEFHFTFPKQLPEVLVASLLKILWNFEFLSSKLPRYSPIKAPSIF